MVYDEQLNAILLEYGLFQDAKESSFSDKIITIITQALDNIPSYKKVAIWGAGEHTRNLIDILPRHVNVLFIVDKSPDIQGKKFCDLMVKSPENIKTENIEVIVVSSYQYHSEIINECKVNYPFCQIIDIYDGLEEVIKEPFYRTPKRYEYMMELFFLRKKYERELHEEEKRGCLLKIISLYLEYRDFVHAYEFMNEYIAMDYEGKEKIGDLKRELSELLLELKRKISSRQYPDVVMTVIDSLREREIVLCSQGENSKKYKYINSLLKKGIRFTNAHSASTYTKACYISMFTGKMIIDDLANQKRSISVNESKILRFLSDKDYSLYQFSGPVMFDETQVKRSQVTNNKFIEKREGNKHETPDEPASSILWRYVCQLAESNHAPTFSILHFMELHFPYICAYHKEKINVYNSPYHYYTDNKLVNISTAIDNYWECLNYVDEQLEFYSDFMHDNITVVLCSDHGATLGEKESLGHLFTWYDELMRVPLIIYNRKYNSVTYDAIFSMKNFGTQLSYILENDKACEIPSLYVELQRDAVYSKDVVNNKKLLDKLGLKFMKGFKVIRSEYDKYVLYDDGSEEYYILPNERDNQINTPAYQARIDEVRKCITNR